MPPTLRVRWSEERISNVLVVGVVEVWQPLYCMELSLMKGVDATVMVVAALDRMETEEREKVERSKLSKPNADKSEGVQSCFVTLYSIFEMVWINLGLSMIVSCSPIGSFPTFVLERGGPCSPFLCSSKRYFLATSVAGASIGECQWVREDETSFYWIGIVWITGVPSQQITTSCGHITIVLTAPSVLLDMTFLCQPIQNLPFHHHKNFLCCCSFLHIAFLSSAMAYSMGIFQQDSCM